MTTDTFEDADGIGRDDGALVAAASAGDRRAAGEFFARNLPRLTAISRKIAGSSYDADDLLGDAILVVVSRWSDGSGPTGNVVAYMAMIMRNRLIDEIRSPRSQWVPFDDADEPQSDDDRRLRLIDIESDLARVRDAMAELPVDQQRVLVATILEGNKPRELVQRFSRPAASIYSLTKRAKLNLRRTLLRRVLKDDADPACDAAADRLPLSVADAPEHTRDLPEHYRDCRRCRDRWARFGALAALGVAPLVVIQNLVSSSPANAASGDASETAPSSADDDVPSGRFALRGRWLTAAGATIIVGGIALIGILALTYVTRTLWFEVRPEASIGVEVSYARNGDLVVDVGFDVRDHEWQTSRLTITTEVQVVGVSAPHGWRCESDGPEVRCSTDLVNARGGIFRLTPLTPVESEYEIELAARTATGASVLGTASGRVNP